MARAAIEESVSPLVVLNADGQGLELTFWIEAGRCAHRLAAIDDTRRAVLLESIEGAVDEPWPPSPPWQQVNAPFGARVSSPNRVHSALLVGAAGASHWSASVEGIGLEKTRRERGQSLSPTGWIFDVACRVKSCPDGLHSTYRIVDPRQIISPSQMVPAVSGQSGLRGGLLELQTDIGRYQLRGLRLASSQAESCQLCVSDERVQLSAPVDWNNQGPTTIRWRYQIGLK